MAKDRFFLGLRGESLRTAQIWAVIMPAYITFGYNNGCIGSLLQLPSWLETFPGIDTVHATGAALQENSRVQGTVVAIYTLGCCFGALSCIYMGDRLGRIRTMQIGCVVSIIGYILQASSYSVAQMIVGRIVTGLGFGAITATAPNWQSECAGASHRGAAVLFESLFISAGLAVQGWINLGLSFTSGPVTWRFPLALPIFFTLILLVTLPMFPESPRWLLQEGQSADGISALAALEGLPEDSEELSTLHNEIIVSLEHTFEASGKGHFRQILSNGEERLFNRACLAAAGQVFQQFGGINALAFYLGTIFHDYLGLSSFQSSIVAASVFTWQTVCSPIGILTVDRFGRRKLMLFAAFGQGMCLAIVAGMVSQGQNATCAIVASVFIFLFSTFFPTGFLGLTFLYAAEIAPLGVRVPITAISTGTAWLANFVVTEITPIGFSTIGWRYFIIYAALNFFMIMPSVYLFFPETAGRHLEEVDEIFKRSKNAFQAVKVARNMPRGAFTEVVREHEQDLKKEDNGMAMEVEKAETA